MICDIGDMRPERQREYRWQTRTKCTGDPPTLPVPVSCGTRSLTAPAPGNMSATISMKQSGPASESRRTSRLSMQTCQSFKTRTTPVGRKSLTLSIRSSPSFSFFRGKTNKARHKLTCHAEPTQNVKFDFLGYCFRSRLALNSRDKTLFWSLIRQSVPRR
jgi:hypothetical protein